MHSTGEVEFTFCIAKCVAQDISLFSSLPKEGSTVVIWVNFVQTESMVEIYSEILVRANGNLARMPIRTHKGLNKQLFWWSTLIYWTIT